MTTQDISRTLLAIMADSGITDSQMDSLTDLYLTMDDSILKAQVGSVVAVHFLSEVVPSYVSDPILDTVGECEDDVQEEFSEWAAGRSRGMTVHSLMRFQTQVELVRELMVQF